MKIFELTADTTLASEPNPAFPAVDYNADMLQRTTLPDSWPDRVDYLVVERIARDMRNQYIASLLSRAKNALVRRLAGRSRATWSPSQ